MKWFYMELIPAKKGSLETLTNYKEPTGTLVSVGFISRDGEIEPLPLLKNL